MTSHVPPEYANYPPPVGLWEPRRCGDRDEWLIFLKSEPPDSDDHVGGRYFTDFGHAWMTCEFMWFAYLHGRDMLHDQLVKFLKENKRG